MDSSAGSGRVQMSAISSKMRQRKVAAKRDELAVLDSVVMLPSISTARAASKTAHVAPIVPPTARPEGLPMLHQIPDRYVIPNRVSTVSAPAAAGPSLFAHLQALAAAARRPPPPSVIPSKFFVYRTAFDLEDDDDSRFAQFEFEHGSGHLTYKIPLFPSVCGDGAPRPSKNLRHEVRYVAQVADKVYATIDSAHRDDPFDADVMDLATGPRSNGAFASASLQIKRTVFLMREAARLVAPTCYELCEIFRVTADAIANVPSSLSTSWSDLVRERQAAVDKSARDAALLAQVTSTITELKEQLAALQAAQLSESERYAHEVQAMGLMPEPNATSGSSPISKKPFRVEITTDQINFLATNERHIYAFSPERVVAGKRFAKHPPIMKDAAVDCTDLYFESAVAPSGRAVGPANPTQPQRHPSTTAATATLADRGGPPASMLFRGKTFLNAVHRVLDISEAAALLRKQGLKLTSDADVPETTSGPNSPQKHASLNCDDMETPNPFSSGTFDPQQSAALAGSAGEAADGQSRKAPVARRGTMTKKKLSKALSLIALRAREAAAKEAATDSAGDAEQSGDALKKTASVAVPAAGSSKASPVGLTSAASFRRVDSMARRATADAQCQAGSTYVADGFIDAAVQVVEADITRKQMRRGGPPRSRGGDSLMATPKPPPSSTAIAGGKGEAAAPLQPLVDLPASVLGGVQGAIAVDGDALWGSPLDVDFAAEAASVRLLPPEVASIGINTEVNLTGFDVTGLPFLDAVQVRFVNTLTRAGMNPDASMHGHELLEDRAFDTSMTPPSRSPRSSALVPPITALGKLAAATKHEGDASASKRRASHSGPLLPDSVANDFGLKTADHYRPHTTAWLNALTLELIKHVDPFKMESQRKSLGAWAFAHFRAKYGLGKMATSYLVDFVGNLKLHHLSSIRAYFLVSWLGLREYAGLSAEAPAFFTRESLYFYVYLIQSIVRTGTHKLQKEFESAELVLPPLRIEQVCDSVLRSVMSSYNDMDEWQQVRTRWHNALLNTAALNVSGLRRMAEEIQVNRGKPGVLDLLPSVETDPKPFPRNVSLDADVLCVLLLVNYPTLQQHMKTRALVLHRQAAAMSATAASADSVAVNANGECVTLVAPPAPLIYSQLVSWPVMPEQLFDESTESGTQGGGAA